jgi:hypothetical protein
MTHPELKRLASAVWGPLWHRPLADALEVNLRTVQRWASGTVPVPDWMASDSRLVADLRARVGLIERRLDIIRGHLRWHDPPPEASE